MEDNHVERNLVGVLFPGIVKNDEKAISCIGGIRHISHIYSNINKKRLGLSFHPDNPFVKKIYASSKKSAGVLLKVKVKKTQMGKEIKREVISTTVVGSVTTMFRFESMCDFQYLPINREGPADAPFKCILEDIIPSGLDDCNFMLQPAPLFLTPPCFTRFEKPIRYTYTEKRYLTDRSSPEQGEDESVHSKIRSLRGSHTAPYKFNLIDDLPSEPSEGSLKLKAFKEEMHPLVTQECETIKEYFKERPIWSLNLLKYHTKIKSSTLKVLMPCLGIYHKTGPWRSMWVRFGYDPRKDPEARKYQTLDFRLRHGQGIRTLILTRDDPVPRGVDQPTSSKSINKMDSSYNEDIAESSVYFGPDTLPTQRHIFYQYCDVNIPEVQQIISAPPPPGHLCHEKRGWLPAGADEQARDHMFKYVRNNLLSSTNAELSRLEQGGVSDSDDSNSDDDTRLSDVDQTEVPTDDV